MEQVQIWQRLQEIPTTTKEQRDDEVQGQGPVFEKEQTQLSTMRETNGIVEIM